MRNPLHPTTLQGTALVLTFWLGIAFVGVPGLVAPMKPSFGFWFWVYTLVWAMMPTMYVLDLFRYRHVKWLAIGVGIFLAGVEYMHHLRGWFFGVSPDYLRDYYGYYQTFYLFGPYDDRLVPDLYHLVLDLMILALNWIGIKRVLVRAYH